MPAVLQDPMFLFWVALLAPVAKDLIAWGFSFVGGMLKKDKDPGNDAFGDALIDLGEKVRSGAIKLPSPPALPKK